jgi:hypothetical protein
MGIDKFTFAGRQVLVVGGATGMVPPATIAQQLGAAVTVMDHGCHRRSVTAIPLDLRGLPASTPPSTPARAHSTSCCRAPGRQNARYREDQLHRPPPSRQRLVAEQRMPRLGDP